MDTSPALPQIDETLLATTRYLEALTQLDDESAGRPSVLPGWSRGHVVAHLSRNADAFTQVLTQVSSGEPASMYASNEARDSDIDEVAALSPSALRERLLASSGLFAESVGHLTEEGWAEEIERVPGGMHFTVASIPARRRTEVEIHHADLGLAYTCDDWPGDFCAALIPVMTARLQDRDQGFTVVATDLNRSWDVAGGGPEISGTGGHLGWWLSGRGGEERLSGDVPEIGEW